MPAEEMGGRALPESPQVATRVILTVVLGFLAFVAMAGTGLYVYFGWTVNRNGLRAVTRDFPEPTLQISPRADLARFETEQRRPLEGYAWVDKAQGIARIPIEDAMRFVAKRGADAYEPIGMAAVTPSPVRGSGGDRP